MNQFPIIVSVVCAYLLGSIPTSVITGRLVKGLDIRDHGSGNAGATNTTRVLGSRWGIFVGFIDLVKGAFAVCIPLWLGLSSPVQLVAGGAAVFGHVFPLFARFKGGKGVATGAGVVLALFPLTFFTVLVFFVMILFISGMVSLASITAALLFPVILYFLGGVREGLAAGDAQSLFMWILSIVLALFVIFLHRKNIVRLVKGEEKRFEKIRIFSQKNNKLQNKTPK